MGITDETVGIRQNQSLISGSPTNTHPRRHSFKHRRVSHNSTHAAWREGNKGRSEKEVLPSLRVLTGHVVQPPLNKVATQFFIRQHCTEVFYCSSLLLLLGNLLESFFQREKSWEAFILVSRRHTQDVYDLPRNREFGTHKEILIINLQI